MPELTSNLLTHSRIQVAKTCLRKHALMFVHRIRREAEAKPLRMGKAFHLGLDARAKGCTADEAIAAAECEYWKAETPGQDNTDIAIERSIVSCLLAGYFWRWARMDSEMEVLASELSFEIPIVNPDTGAKSRTYTLAGKIDKIVRLPGGRVAIMEHKTSSEDLSVDSDYWKRLRMDAQISIYFLAAERLGFSPETVLYDVVRKPTIRPKNIQMKDEQGLVVIVDQDGNRVFKKDGTPRLSPDSAKGYSTISRIETPREYADRLFSDMGERPDYYFARRDIPRLAQDIEETRYELWQMAGLIRECERYNRWPRNTRACIGFGKCEFFDFCTGTADVEVIPEGYTRVGNVHPELEE